MLKRKTSKTKIMKRKLFKLLILMCTCKTLQAQVGMNTNNPHKSAALDMKAESNKGLLIPNVNLSSTTDVNSIIGGIPAQSLLVYNTNAAITGTGAAGTGYYYWDTNIWKKLTTKDDTSDSINTEWYLAGGTTDAGSNKTGSINRTGKVGIGLTSPNLPNALLDIKSPTAGAIKLTDGTEGDGKVLTSDSNGLATWQTKGPQTMQGSVPTGNQSYLSTLGLRYTGYSITVPPGRSTVTAGLIVVPPGNGYATCRLSTSSSAFTQPSGVVPNYSGFTVVNSTSTGQVMWYTNNTSGSPMTYYVWMTVAGGATVSGQNLTLGGSSLYGEAFIMVAY